MKVKDLAVIFKVEVSELLAMLSNVGVNLDKQEDTNIDSAMEKKLAKRYGVAYPFKTAPKPINKVVPQNVKETKLQNKMERQNNLLLKQRKLIQKELLKKQITKRFQMIMEEMKHQNKCQQKNLKLQNRKLKNKKK